MNKKMFNYHDDRFNYCRQCGSDEDLRFSICVSCADKNTFFIKASTFLAKLSMAIAIGGGFALIVWAMTK